jgi:chemotaxis protein MotA
MDLATVCGVLMAWCAVVGALWLEGSDMSSLFSAPAALLVFGGTLGATAIGFRVSELLSLPAVLRQAFGERIPELSEVVDVLVRMADRARRDGTLALEKDLVRVDDAFLQRGLRLLIDRTDPTLFRSMLQNDIRLLQARQRVGENVFLTLGGFAPTLGIIGTVLGLVHMLANLTDPMRMGPLIANAFLATLYGVGSANLIFLPIANKLRARTAEEVQVREVMLEGLLALQSGQHPRIIEERLSAYLEPLPGRAEPGQGRAARAGLPQARPESSSEPALDQAVVTSQPDLPDPLESLLAD